MSSCAHSHRLELQNVSAHYQNQCVLENITFSVECGTRLALLGPNGAGKSTLIKILAGLKKPTTGTITWQGKPLQKWSKEIAYLPQMDQHQLNFPATVRNIVEMGRYPHLGFWRKMRPIDFQKVDEAIERMEISSFAHKQIDALSGGQRQRVFIARALAQEAHVILLDEPFNGLDSESRIHLAVNIEKLTKQGHLIISSHHNLDTVTQIFDEALVVNRSQVKIGDAKSVMESPEVHDLFHCNHHDSIKSA